MHFEKMIIQHFTHTKVWKRKFDLAVKRSKIILGSLGKNHLQFLSYTDLAAISGTKQFEETDKTHSKEGPM